MKALKIETTEKLSYYHILNIHHIQANVDIIAFNPDANFMTQLRLLSYLTGEQLGLNSVEHPELCELRLPHWQQGQPWHLVGGSLGY